MEGIRNTKSQTHYNNQYISKPFYNTTTGFFTPDKNRTNSFFRNSKVGSCKYVMVKNGQSKAMPFRIRNERGRCLNHYKTVPKKLEEVKSVYEHDYFPVPNLHCGMGKKPLMPYDPDSCRSRMPITGVVMGLNNRSYISIGDRGMINRKQWSSTYRDNFRWPTLVPISNPGITSDIAKQNHMKLNG